MSAEIRYHDAASQEWEPGQLFAFPMPADQEPLGVVLNSNSNPVDPSTATLIAMKAEDIAQKDHLLTAALISGYAIKRADYDF